MAQGGKAVGVVAAAAIVGGGGAALKGIEIAAVSSAVVRGVEYEMPNIVENGAKQLGRETAGDTISSFHPAPAEPLILPSPPRVAVGRPIIIPGAFAEFSYPKGSEKIIVDAITNQATPKIIQGLDAFNGVLTYKQVYRVVNVSLKSTADNVAAESKSAVKFEMLSGKLSIEKPAKIGKFEVTFGEINIYKVTSVATVAIMACKGLQAAQRQNCVGQALSKVGKAFVDQKDDRNKEAKGGLDK